MGIRRTVVSTRALVVACGLWAWSLGAAEPTPEVAARIGGDLGVAAFSTLDLVLPVEGLPDVFTVKVPREGTPATLVLTRASVRSPHLVVLAQVAGGAFVQLPPPPSRTYRGVVEGERGSVVAASLLPEGLSACVLTGDGEGWAVRPLRLFDAASPRERHVVYRLGDVELPECGQEDMELDFAPSSSGAAPAGKGGSKAACTLKVADIAFDSDYEYYSRKCDSDAALAVAIVEDGLNITNAIYIRDVQITHALATVVLRTDPATDFYAQFADGSNFGAMLDAFRVEWNANMTHIDRDVAYLLTGKPNPNYGGLAWVRVVCSNYSYGMGIGGAGYEGIFRHEVGHNWGAGHSCGDERKFIMCGNSISAISAYNIRIMREFSDGLGCLEEQAYESTTAEEPYVRLDPVVVTQGDGAIAVDVLDGDTDADCDVLTLAAFDERSAYGASIRVIDTLSAADREALLYSPRADFIGTDWFKYTASDGAGFAVDGVCTVKVLPRGLVGYYPLDETSGTDTVDASGFGNDGELRGELDFAANSVAGRFGSALSLRGIDDEYVSLGDVSLFDLRGGLTVAAWFNLTPGAGDETLLGKGGDAWRLKRDGTNPVLEFTCNGLLLAGGAEPHVVATTPIDDGAWHHAAGVYDGAALYIYVDGVLEATAAASGVINANGTAVHIGDNAWVGAIDEVRLFNYGMGAGEVRALFDNGRVENPDPRNGARDAIPGAALTWQAAPAATAHDVYVGTNAQAVAAATTASPEYKGRRTTTSYTPATVPGATYFWRVDEIVDGTARRGDVRSFTVCSAYTDFDDPPLDASSFTPGAGDTELGFKTVTTPTGGQDPFAGVIDTGSTPTTPVFSHRSIGVVTTFDAVALAEETPMAVSLMLQVRDTEYEQGDLLDVYATNGAEQRRLVRIEGGSQLTQLAGAGYARFAALLPPEWTTARVVIATSGNSSSGNERYDFDRIAFYRDAPWALLAYTDFGEPAVGAASYVRPAAGKELGFETVWTATSGANPLVAVGEAPGPHHARFFTHRSAAATTTFQDVDLRAWDASFVRATVRIADTDYEAEDKLEIYVTDGTARRDLVNVRGTTGLNGFTQNRYISFEAAIPDDWQRARLVIATSSNSGSAGERFDVCRVEFLSRCTTCTDVPPEPQLRRGDSNGDGKLDISDAIKVLGFLFGGMQPPTCRDSADANDDGRTDIGDAISILSHLFAAAGPLPAPFGACGPDPTADTLECVTYQPCGTGV